MRRLLALMMLGACATGSGQPSDRFERALQRNLVSDAAFARGQASIERVAKAYLPDGWRFGGVNPGSPAPEADALRVYVANARNMLTDELLCGTTEVIAYGGADCIAAARMVNNCIALSGIVACDERLVWDILFLAVTTLVDWSLEGTSVLKGLPFFFTAFDEAAQADVLEERWRLLAQKHAFFEIPKFTPLLEDLGTFEDGFFSFVLAHEIGHLWLGHPGINGAYQDVLAFESMDPDQLRMEQAADEYFVARSRRPPFGKLSAEYAAPLLFFGLSRWQLMLAIQIAGLEVRPELDYPPPESERWVRAYLDMTCGTSHPYLMSRYLMIAKSDKFAAVSYPGLIDDLAEVTAHENLCLAHLRSR